MVSSQNMILRVITQYIENLSLGHLEILKLFQWGHQARGGLLLIHMLNALENFEIDTLGWNSSDYVHLVTEIAKRAYADRAQHLGDPDFWKNPRDMFLSKPYAKKRVSDISMNELPQVKKYFLEIMKKKRAQKPLTTLSLIDMVMQYQLHQP